MVPGDFTTRFPYTCQLGDYLKPAAVADGASVMGRRLSIRERSFLDNPRTDPQNARRDATAGVRHRAGRRAAHFAGGDQRSVT